MSHRFLEGQFTERERQAGREFREFVAEEDRKQREAEDRAEYRKYVNELESQQRHCAPAERVEPLSFEEWRKFIPEEMKDEPASLRGAVATANYTMTRLKNIATERLKSGVLTDAELATLGFDLDDKVIIPEQQLSVPLVLGVFERFKAREPRFRKSLHFQAMADFFCRNDLLPTDRHVSLVWNTLLGIGAISLPEPEPEPERPEGVNAHGVSLSIEPDPAVEARKRRDKYETQIVVTDPETGQGYTEYMLDRVDSETFRRLMRIPRISEFRPEPQR